MITNDQTVDELLGTLHEYDPTWRIVDVWWDTARLENADGILIAANSLLSALNTALRLYTVIEEGTA